MSSQSGDRTACCASGRRASRPPPRTGRFALRGCYPPRRKRNPSAGGVERMDERDTLHVIEEDLAEGWVDDMVESGVAAIQEYLAKHLAFLVYLDDATAGTSPQAL